MSNSPTPGANPTWFDLLLGGGFVAIAINGTIVPQAQVEHVLNFVNAFTAADNPTAGSIDLTFTGASSGGPPTGVDVVGADLAHVYVGSISGFGAAGGTVALNVAQLQWGSAQTAVSFTQATAPLNVAPASWTFTSQAPNAGSSGAANQTPGSFVFNLPAPIGSGTFPGFIISSNGSPIFRLDAGTAHGGPSDPLIAFWMGAPSAAPTTTNWLFAWDPIGLTMSFAAPATSSGAIEMTTAGNVSIFGGTTAGSIIAITCNQSSTAPAYVNIGADVSPGGSNMMIGAAALTGNRHVSVLNATATANVTPTQIPSGDWVTYIANTSSIPSSNPVSGAVLYATSGNLWIYPSSGSPFQIGSGSGGSVTWLHDLAGSNSTSGQWVAGLSGNGGTTAAIPLRSGAYISVTDGQPVIGDGTTTFVSTGGSASLNLNAATSQHVNLQIAGSTIVDVNGANVTINAATAVFFSQNTDCSIAFSGTQSGTASNLFLVGQKSTGGISGNVNARVYAPGSGTTEAMFQVLRNSGGTDAMVWAFGRETTSNSGMWAHGVTPSASNYAMIAGSSTFLNASSVAVGLQIAGSTIGQWQASSGDFLAFGGGPSASGFIRTSLNATIITAKASGGSDMAILATDGSNDLIIGDNVLMPTITYQVGPGGSGHLFNINGSLTFQVGSTIKMLTTPEFTPIAATTVTPGTHTCTAWLGFINAIVAGVSVKIPFASP